MIFAESRKIAKMIKMKQRIYGRPTDSTDLYNCLQTSESDSEVLYKCPHPPALDHLLTFTSSCHHPRQGSHIIADKAPCDPFYLRVHVRGVYKMWNIKRQFKVRTTSRRATPLGDPRGVPKLFRKCSSLKSYRIAYDKFQDILHLKFESSLRFLVIGVKAKRKIYKVILDIEKMSDFVPEADLPNELFEILRQFEVSSDINPVMDQFDPKELDEMLNNNDIDINSDNTGLINIDYADLPFAPGHHRSQTLLQEHEATLMMVTPPPEVIPDNSHQNVDQVWNGPWTPPPQEPEAVRVSVIQQPQTFSLSVLDDSFLYSNTVSLAPVNIMQPAASEVAVVDERQIDLQRRNNIASAEYRSRKKVKKELEEAELKELERRNIELAARVSVMEEVIKRMRDNYFDMIRGVKRPSQEPSYHHCCDKKPKLN